MYQARALSSWPGQRRGMVLLPMNPRWSEIATLVLPIQAFANITWTTADTAVGYWITAPEDCTVYKIGWYNGSAVGGNTDAAIYDSDGVTRLVSTGSTAGSGASGVQMVDTADVNLVAGKRYFVALNHSTTTANELIGMNATSFTLAAQLFAGIKVQAVGATALPDPFVPADPAAAVALPSILLQTRSF